MKSIRLFTWLDIRRLIFKQTNYGNQLPEGIVSIRCFSDALEIGILNESHRNDAEKALKNWFGDWYQTDQSIILLDMGDAILPVEFILEEERSNQDISLRPFWEEIVYINKNEEENDNLQKFVKLPEPYPMPPNLVSFYSFKGGVGRTLHLAAHIFALLDRAKALDKSITILVIDADLEAPGLTYWNRAEKQQPSVSFIDFLEVYHYPSVELETAIALFAKELQKSAKSEGNSTIYFLPACIDDQQLLDTPILPENLVRNPNDVWECGNAIYKLGKAVSADYVLIDLRAGLSEISSPIIFDPRINRFLVTTINEQSVMGTSLVLEQIGRIAPPANSIDEQIYSDPSLIIGMLTPELKDLPNFGKALEKFQSAYIQPEENSLYSTRLEVKETYFSQELLYVNNWEDARQKLNPTSVMTIAKEWASEQIQNLNHQQLPLDNNNQIDPLKAVRTLRDVCEKYIYAETGQGEDLLVTKPLTNLATTFRDDLPHIVSIGSKGAGKTFNYIQLSRFKYWENFLLKIYDNDESINTVNSKTYIFPLLQSAKLRDIATNIIQAARHEFITALGDSVPGFTHSEYVDRIKNAISSCTWNEPEWTNFWIEQIAISIGINPKEIPSFNLAYINRYLKDKGLKVIFLFDGLEDIFTNIASEQQQKIALKALIEDFTNKLSEIRQSNLGAIIFLRRDFLRSTITQNLKQFENLYQAYDLAWDVDSFLRLVFWICGQSEVIGAEKNKDQIESLSREELITRLELLWGKKLGSDNSKEAHSFPWIFAALTDFNGRLQARDIVRFLYFAAYITADQAKDLQFVTKWSTSRLLPPRAIRQAIESCSKEKVEETKEEYPVFKTWVEEKLKNYNPSDKKIPFAVEQFNMEQQTVRMLEEMGVIYEDKEQEDMDRFYMPEIFREGLGFSLGKVARPRVMVLKRKALGKIM